MSKSKVKFEAWRKHKLVDSREPAYEPRPYSIAYDYGGDPPSKEELYVRACEKIARQDEFWFIASKVGPMLAKYINKMTGDRYSDEQIDYFATQA